MKPILARTTAIERRSSLLRVAKAVKVVSKTSNSNPNRNTGHKPLDPRKVTRTVKKAVNSRKKGVTRVVVTEAATADTAAAVAEAVAEAEAATTRAEVATNSRKEVINTNRPESATMDPKAKAATKSLHTTIGSPLKKLSVQDRITRMSHDRKKSLKSRKSELP